MADVELKDVTTAPSRGHKRGASHAVKDYEDNIDLAKFNAELSTNFKELGLDASAGPSAEKKKNADADDDIELGAEFKDDSEPFDEEKAREEAIEEMTKELGDKSPVSDFINCTEEGLECPWHWSRYVWIICFIASVIFVALGASEDQPAYSYIFSILFIIVTLLATWLSWNYWSLYRIAQSIKQLWLILQRAQIENKKFEHSVLRLEKQKKWLIETEAKLKEHSQEFVDLNKELSGSVQDFEDSQKKLQDNLLKASSMAKESLKLIEQERKLVQGKIREQVQEWHDDQQEMLALIFGTFTVKNVLDENGYKELVKVMTDNFDNFFDVIRIFNLDPKEYIVQLPTWENISVDEDGEKIDPFLERDYADKMDPFLKKLNDLAFTHKTKEVAGEKEKIQKAALLLKEVAEAFQKNVESRKKCLEEARAVSKVEAGPAEVA